MGKKKNQPTQEEVEITKIRIPRNNEVLGIAEALVGGDRVRVRCDDGNVRICRIPGRLRKRVWISIGDIVLVEPWKVETEKKGDIVFRYTSTQANWLRRKSYAKTIEIGF
ncbi:MAG: translation initiation factor eIF-1A [Candidatus Aenigmarchaeota archaeon]|nr:translation initiation factor eIF-1A [Candidatus Aenigmarchaeota archaeon]